MATRITSTFTKAIATIFTSIVAPILVAWAVHDLQGEEKAPRPAARPALRDAAPEPAKVEPAPPIAARNSLVAAAAFEQRVTGVGRTPQDAARNALRTAVERAVAARLDADTWARRGPAIVEAVLRSNGLIVSWRVQSTSRQWRVRGTFYSCDVSVGLSRAVLHARLVVTDTPALSPSWQPTPWVRVVRPP